ncbi:MAG: tyrosine-protein phosphatase [Eubacteriales bacterium]
MRFYDIHCHILPGLDDGAFFPDETVKMAELASRRGTECIVCTPHFYPDGRYGLAQLTDAFDQARNALSDAGVRLELLPGQEIYLDEDYLEAIALLKAERLLTLNRTVYPLIEFDPLISERAVFAALNEIFAAGLVPVIAHPERYAFVAEDTENLYRLKRTGAILQMNKGSIAGAFGHGAARVADMMIREHLADVAASDAHSPYRRTPALDEFHRWMCEEISEDYADILVSINPLHIIKNEKIELYS